MPTLNLQEAQVGVSLAIQIFDEFFIELHKNDDNLQSVTFQVPVIDELELVIDQIRYVYEASISSTLLQVSDNLENIFEAQIDVIIASIDELFNDTSAGSIGGRIDGVEIDMITTVIEGLEVILFPDEDTRPDRVEWESELKYLPAENNESMDSIAIFIAMPGNSPNTDAAVSFLNSKTGFGIIFNKNFLQDVFDQGAEDSIGTERCGARLDSLSLTLQDDRIQIEGSVSKSLVDIPFDGPGFPFLYRGTTEMSIDTSQVDAEEPSGLEGFLRFLGILTAIFLPFIGGAIFGLLGIIGGVVADIWLVPSIWGAAEDLENADSSIQSGLAGALGAQLSALSSGLNIQEDVEMVTLESTPNQLRFIDGHYLFDALIFVSPIEETITNGWFSSKYSRFVFYQLEGGQKFKTSELARLVRLEKITTPGFHDVQHSNGRLYMRADRDDAETNNLQEQFRENPPDEPFPVMSDGDSDDDDC